MLLKPILQGVMQVNFDDMMEFSDYFEGIRNIANMRVRQIWSHITPAFNSYCAT